METPILTPMQQVIDNINNLQNVEGYDYIHCDYLMNLLQSHLPKEQEAIEQAYKADLYPCSDEDATEYFNKTYKDNGK